MKLLAARRLPPPKRELVAQTLASPFLAPVPTPPDFGAQVVETRV